MIIPLFRPSCLGFSFSGAPCVPASCRGVYSKGDYFSSFLSPHVPPFPNSNRQEVGRNSWLVADHPCVIKCVSYSYGSRSLTIIDREPLIHKNSPPPPLKSVLPSSSPPESVHYLDLITSQGPGPQIFYIYVQCIYFCIRYITFLFVSGLSFLKQNMLYLCFRWRQTL